MPNRPATDNFLPYDRSKDSFLPRPTMHIPRRDYTSRSYSRQRPISDFLSPEIYPKKRQLAPAAPLVSATSVLAFDPLFNPNRPSKIKTQLKLTLLQKKFIYSLAAIVIVLGGTASLIGLKTSRQPTEQVKAFQMTVPSIPPKTEQVSFGLPERLMIPRLNIDATIEQVGLTPNGELGTPKDPTNAGWYAQGLRPGENGPSVIDGHSGWQNDIPAVFDNLHKLQEGDKLYIQDDKGVIIAFVVRASRSYDPETDASDVFNSNDGKAHLNLITCEGAWDKTQKSYSERLVVFADRELP